MIKREISRAEVTAQYTRHCAAFALRLGAVLIKKLLQLKKYPKGAATSNTDIRRRHC